MALSFNKDQMRVLEAMQQGKNVFLSGKAGSGKSTVLRLFYESAENTLVCAPTGLAALNIGGTTIHSLLELPVIRADISNTREKDTPVISYITSELLRAYPLSPYKKEVLANARTIIIDEISMVRADVFDAVNWRLQEATESEIPFGGKQIIVVGDFMQLGPIAWHDRASTAATFKPLFAFQSLSWRCLNWQRFFLMNSYRQYSGEGLYLDFLNAVRYGDVGQLNSLYNMNKTMLQEINQIALSRSQSDCISLCTTNLVADEINRQRVAALSGHPVVFNASISGNFPEEYYPTGTSLVLKPGMRVMVLVNVRDRNRFGFQYVNGDLGTIVGITPAVAVDIMLDRNGTIITVGYTLWENIEYRIKNGRIDAVCVGSFRQLPIRPAYALSVHKAQGLTIPRLKFVRGNGCFTHGQLYVALSRCNSLDGIALESPIQNSDLIVDDTVKEFEMYLEFLPSHYYNHAIHFLIGYDNPWLSPMDAVQAIWLNYQHMWTRNVRNYIYEFMGERFSDTDTVLPEAGQVTDPVELEYGVDKSWMEELQLCRYIAEYYRHELS